jgi:microcystin-dependent protein
MSDQFVGEIRLFPYNFAPRDWAICQGQLLPISQNPALFSLLGTNYGGNGTSNFGLPDLRDRVPIHWGNGAGLTPIVIGETGGEASVTLQTNELPPHNHPMGALAASATAIAPAAGAYPAEGHGQGRGAYKIRTFAPSGTATSLLPTAVGPAGSGQPHNNLQPSLAMNWFIALTGIFPARN